MPRRRIPSLNWLRVFEAAARSQSFARAAEQLGMSSAAVSQQIKALEVHFQRPLFTRGAHHIELTPAGRAFLPSVQQALSTVEVTAASLFGNPQREPLTIRASTLFTNSWLAAHINDFIYLHPHINLHISTENNSQTPAQREFDCQISFGSGPQYGEEGDLLFTENLYAVALPSINANIQMLADLLQYRLIDISGHHTGWVQLFQQDLEMTLEHTELLFTDNTTTAFVLAAHGTGIALARDPVSRYLYPLFGLERSLVDLSISGSQHYYLTYPSLAGLSAAGKQFRAWLLNQPDVLPGSSSGSLASTGSLIKRP